MRVCGCFSAAGGCLTGNACTLPHIYPVQLAIANTMIHRRLEDQWTYSNDGRRRQVDYCLIDASQSERIIDAGANDDIIMGQDHRAIKLALTISPKHQTHGNRKKNERTNMEDA